MNKLFLLTLTGLLLAASGHAQDFKTRLPSKSPKIVIDMQGTDVVVEGIDGDELIIKGDGYEEPPKRADGLRPMYNTAVDNTRLGLSVTQEGNVVRITRASRRSTSYVIRVPRASAVQYKQAGWNGSGDVVMRDVSGDLEVSMTSGDIKLTNVAGPVVANTVSGDVTVRFTPLRQGPSSISTVSGDVDISLPVATKATMRMRSISGEVYTDFDMNTGNKQNDMQHIGGQVVDGSINGGGNALSLKTVSGDIFVRKAK
jgi:lia operon protein LiaG